jgi:hypothetical protein
MSPPNSPIFARGLPRANHRRNFRVTFDIVE